MWFTGRKASLSLVKKEKNGSGRDIELLICCYAEIRLTSTVTTMLAVLARQRGRERASRWSSLSRPV